MAVKLDWPIGQSDLTGLRFVVQSQVQHELTFHQIFCHGFRSADWNCMLQSPSLKVSNVHITLEAVTWMGKVITTMCGMAECAMMAAT